MYPLKRFSLGELRNINASQHRAVGDPLAYGLLVRPCCTFLQRAIPRSIAPNSITWLGFMVMTASFFATMYSDPLLAGPSRWLSLLNAMSILVYVTTDSLDGIHARSTGQCSPLGKILDHFVDSTAVLFSTITLCSSLRTGYSATAQIIVSSIMLGFYIAAISERYTECMKFSLISGACEGLLCIMCIHAISFVSPGMIDTVLYSGKYLNRTRVTELFLIWAMLYISYILIELVRDISRQPTKKNYRAIAFDILKPVLLVLMVSPLFRFSSQSPFMVFSYLMIYGNSFSLCYLEDYIASMSKAPADNKVFMCVLLILGAQSIVHIGSYSAKTTTRLLLLVSAMHFAVRSILVLRSLAKSLNTKLFTRTL